MKKHGILIITAVLGGFLIWGTGARAEALNDLLSSAGVASYFENTLSEEEYLECAQNAEGAHWGYTNIGIANVDSGNLNVRAQASTDSSLVGKMPNRSACEIVDYENGWAHIISGEVEGYVSLDFLLTGADAVIEAENNIETVAIAKVDGLNVRVEPGTDSEIMTQILENEELEYVGCENGWVQVSVDGTDAFVSEEFVTVESKLPTAITMSELLYGNGVSDVRVDLVEYAKQFLGNKYVWGGTSLTKGCDCSGFVLSVFAHYGVKLSHSSRAQANEGTKVDVADLKPGDLIFYGKGKKGRINHVAIYIGGGQVIHASSPKTGIKISKYNYRTPVKCVRVLSD
ncbi:MAG: C40 family peptidase [Lachnospiraceae bacterium]|nr:C40 family peptidase [Lachnospiraceae bacterium]